MEVGKENNYAAGVALAFLAALLWSGNYIVARGFYAQISPVTLAFFRWFTATLLLFPFAYKQVKNHWKSAKRHWTLLCITAFIGVTLFNTFIYIAGRYSTAINLAILGTTIAPIFVLIFAGLFLKEKVSGYQVGGMAICIGGILLLITNGQLSNLKNFRFSPGDFWIVLAAFAFAIYTLLVRKKPPSLSAVSYLFILFFLGTLFLLPAFIFDSRQGLTFIPSKQIIGVFLYLGAGASVGAFLAWNVAIQKIGAARTSLFSTLIPVFSSIEAVVFLGEESSWVLVVSLAVIVAGLLIATFKNLKKKKAA